MSTQDSIFCPKCGHESASELRFCRQCGTDLGLVGEALAGAVVRAPSEDETHAAAKVAMKRTVRGVVQLLLSAAPAKLMFFILSVYTYLVATGGSAIVGGVYLVVLLASLMAFLLLLGSGIRNINAGRLMKAKLLEPPVPPRSLPSPPAAVTVDGLDGRAFETMSPPSVTEGTTRRMGKDEG